MRKQRAVFSLATPGGFTQHVGPWLFVSEDAVWSANYAYLCPTTGEVWARLQWELVSGVSPANYYALMKSSEAAPTSWHSGDRPGSLLHSLAMLFALPEDLLTRELLTLTSRGAYGKQVANTLNAGIPQALPGVFVSTYQPFAGLETAFSNLNTPLN